MAKMLEKHRQREVLILQEGLDEEKCYVINNFTILSQQILSRR